MFQITKKLAGRAAGTSMWATSVGNETGHVLNTAMTVAEGKGLDVMAQALVQRYADANVPAPKLLYVDRDCCGQSSDGKAKALFAGWPDLVTRLDIYHFMRR